MGERLAGMTMACAIAMQARSDECDDRLDLAPGIPITYEGKPALKYQLPDGSVLLRYTGGALHEVCADCLCGVTRGHDAGCTGKYAAIMARRSSMP